MVGRVVKKREDGLIERHKPKMQTDFNQSLPRARSPFTQPPSVEPPPPPYALFAVLNPSFLWEIHSALQQQHECQDVLGWPLKVYHLHV